MKQIYEKHLGSWSEVLEDAMKVYEDKTRPKLKGVDPKLITPGNDNIFRAFRECPWEDLKVVILGMDPYFDGSATGLAFDNPYPTSKISPSLRNILDELSKDYVDTDLEAMEASGSYLGSWPSQGVLLINTALTTQIGKAGAHASYWKPFTKEVIKAINNGKDRIIWVLWGGHALSFKDMIDNPTHYFIISSHPSPLGYTKELKDYPPFKDSRPFSKVNKILTKIGKPKIIF